ncbi:MAG TPA: hypothetical protein ENI62_06440 [Gammaproteobacteria bacterium]|nr:hypothetical protein [Gammaproteobacteria bacterium]
MKKNNIMIFSLLLLLISSCSNKQEKDTVSPGKLAQELRLTIKNVVKAAATGLGGIVIDRDGKVDTALIRKFVANADFLDDKTGYFFVNDFTNNYIIANPKEPNAVGNDGSNRKDYRGNFFIRLMANKAITGGGYLNYFVKDTATGKEQIKESYVEIIPNTNFYIGAGQYIGLTNYPRYRNSPQPSNPRQ